MTFIGTTYEVTITANSSCWWTAKTERNLIPATMAATDLWKHLLAVLLHPPEFTLSYMAKRCSTYCPLRVQTRTHTWTHIYSNQALALYTHTVNDSGDFPVSAEWICRRFCVAMPGACGVLFCFLLHICFEQNAFSTDYIIIFPSEQIGSPLSGAERLCQQSCVKTNINTAQTSTHTHTHTNR